MRMAICAVEAGCGGEMIFASGVTWHGRDFVQQLFARHGLNYACHVEVPALVESPFFEVDLADTLRQLPIGPREYIFTLCDRLIAQSLP
mgnify:CR=1 FL=1